MKCACAILSSLACLTLRHFSTLFRKLHDFRKKSLNKKCVFWSSLQNLSEAFLILRGTERDMIKNVYWSSPKVHVILIRFYWNLDYPHRFLKSSEIWNFMKIRLVGAELLHEDGRTDRCLLIVDFRNVAKAPQLNY